MRRVRRDDNEEIEFVPLRFDPDRDPHYRVEIKVHDLDEVRRLHREGVLIGLRMIGEPNGRAAQRSIIGPHDIEGLGLPNRRRP